MHEAVSARPMRRPGVLRAHNEHDRARGRIGHGAIRRGYPVGHDRRAHDEARATERPRRPDRRRDRRCGSGPHGRPAAPRASRLADDRPHDLDATGHYRLRHRPRAASSARVRVRVAGTSATRSLGRLNAYRRASASWYGPGLYGNHLACGGRLSDSVRGVAHKSLPCGTRVTLRKGDRIVRARVVDRGPFVAGREFDLTPAVKRALGFGSTGSVDVAM